MDQSFTWAMLATHAGATAATTIVVQFLKSWLDNIIKLPTQLVSYIVALVVMLAATGFTGALSASGVGLIIINAIVVSLASNGAFEAVTHIKATKK